jgi:hypothetical protein
LSESAIDIVKNHKLLMYERFEPRIVTNPDGSTVRGVWLRYYNIDIVRRLLTYATKAEIEEMIRSGLIEQGLYNRII